jgi:hypothetical protein
VRTRKEEERKVEEIYEWND